MSVAAKKQKGNKQTHTPTLRKLAKNSVVFFAVLDLILTGSEGSQVMPARPCAKASIRFI